MVTIMTTVAAITLNQYINLPKALSAQQLDLLMGKERPQFVSPSLTSWEFAFVGKRDGKFSMHLIASISGKEAVGDAGVTITQEFSVNRRSYAICLVQSSLR